jgi:hypothetical protein
MRIAFLRFNPHPHPLPLKGKGRKSEIGVVAGV